MADEFDLAEMKRFASGVRERGKQVWGKWDRTLTIKTLFEAIGRIEVLALEVDRLRDEIKLRSAAHEAGIELDARLSALQNSDAPK